MKIPKIGVWDYKASGTMELKYSIRSAIKNLGIEKVVIVGDCPSWFEQSDRAVWVESKLVRSVSFSPAFVTWQHLAKLAETNNLPEEFLWFNDDFFILQPLTEWQDYARDPDDYERKVVKKGNYVYKRMEDRCLLALKNTDGKHYNLHIPMRLERDKVLLALSEYKKTPFKEIEFRTFYGNKFLPDAPFLCDVKYGQDPVFFSSGDDWWTNYGKRIMNAFPDKTFCEKGIIK